MTIACQHPPKITLIALAEAGVKWHYASSVIHEGKIRAPAGAMELIQRVM